MAFDFLRRKATAPPEAKHSAAAPLLALQLQGRAVWTPRDFAALAREGFQRNPIAYRAVRLLAESAASVPLLLYDGANEIEAHPLLDLLARPNPRLTGAAFRESLAGHLLVAGNAYAEVVCLEGTPRELHVLRPDRVRVVPGPDGWPMAFDYTVDGRAIRLPQDAEPLPSVLHLTQFDPLDDHYGFAPLAAAARAIDMHNAAAGWNKALLDNAARPSGALVYQGDGKTLSADQFERLKQELEDSYQGAMNAGRPLLLEGGLTWTSMSLSPRDMDFLEARREAAREIAIAIGVPPMLIGIPGEATYANYQEANRAFWRQTVIPLVRRMAASLAQWLTPAYGVTGLRLEPDIDQVEALSAEREALWRRLSAAEFLSEDEKRAAVGYGPRTPGSSAPANGDAHERS